MVESRVREEFGGSEKMVELCALSRVVSESTSDRGIFSRVKHKDSTLHIRLTRWDGVDLGAKCAVPKRVTLSRTFLNSSAQPTYCQSEARSTWSRRGL